MTTWTRTTNIVIDIDAIAANAAVRRHDRLGRPSAISPGGAPAIVWVQGDFMRLRFWPWSTADRANVRFPEGDYLIVSGAIGALTLFQTRIALETAEGGDDETGWYYDVPIDLHTAEIAQALQAAGNQTISVPTDILIATADNTEPNTWRINVTIIAEVYSGQSSPTIVTRPSEYTVKAPIDIGANYILLQYAHLALSEAPAVILPTIRAPAADVPIIFPTDQRNVTASSAIITLSAAPEIEDYQLIAVIVPGVAPIQSE